MSLIYLNLESYLRHIFTALQMSMARLDCVGNAAFSEGIISQLTLCFIIYLSTYYHDINV